MNPKKASRVAESTTAEILRKERIDEFGFRGYGDSSVDMLNPVDTLTMMHDSHKMWLKNPLANSIIELQIDFALGDGITFNAEDESVQEVLEDYWFDYENDWENKGTERFRDLSINGELIIKPSTTMADGKERPTGKVKVETLYPDFIKKVVIVGDCVKGIIGNDDKQYRVIGYNELTGAWEGDLFYYQVNKTTHSTRGVSDLFTIRDWLSLYDKSLYATMERTGLLLSFVWDVTVKGADENKLREKYNQINKNPPRPGSYRVHNENESWEEKTPALGGRDFESIYNMLKSQIIGGSRQPEHYFGMGGDVNLATASVMNRPYIMKIKRRQRFWRKILTDQFDHVIWNAQRARVLSPSANTEYSINIPEPDKDIAPTIADAVAKFAQSLTLLENNGYIDSKTSTSVVKVLLSQLGVEVSNDEDESKIIDAMAQVAKNKALADAKKKALPVENEDGM